MNLTVIEKFAAHEVGDVITDAEKVAALLKSEFARFVVKVAPTSPAPQPALPSVAKAAD